jgi:rRNA maturation protein Nop10
MALAQCRECKGTVSTLSKSCPHCGVPNPAPASISPANAERLKRLTTVLLWVGWPLFIILMYIQSTHNPAGILH